MATVNKLLAERGTFDTKHRQATRILQTAAANAAPNRRALVTGIANAELAYDALLNAHATYVIKLGATMDNVEHQQWIDLRGDAHVAAQEAAQGAIALLDADPANVVVIPARNIADVREDIDMLRLRVNALHAALQQAVAQPMTVLQHEALVTQSTELDVLLANHRDLYAQLRHADPANANDHRAECQAYQNQKVPISEEIKIALAAGRPAPAAAAVIPPVVNPAAGVGAAAPGLAAAAGPAVPPDNRRQAKLRPTSPPKFSGKAKDYTRFKLKFDEMIHPFYDETSQLDFLESALPEGVKGKMSLVRKTVAQIWEQLEDLFNNPKIILKESVTELNDLFKLKLSNADLIVKFHNTLVDTEALLDSIGQGAYLRHPREVAAMEDLLPREEAREYVRREARLPGNEFEKLKAFLAERKTEIQKLEMLGTRYRTDHSDTPDNKDQKKFTKGCFNCGEEGHISRDCPKPRKDREGGGGKGDHDRGGGGRSKKANNSHQQAQTNTFRPSSCRRCKTAGKSPKPCPGCNKSNTDLDHCLGHCSKFTMESVAGKTDIVKKGNACVICLGTNHTADACNFKDKETSLCGLDGCSSHHHPTLHGSRDKFVTSVSATMIKLPVMSQSSQETFSQWKQKEEILHPINQGRHEEEWERKMRDKELEEIRLLLGEPMLDGDQILLMLQSIWVKFGLESSRKQLAAFIDNGSTCSLILESVAEKLNLPGQNIRVTISTINGEKERCTKLYIVELLNSQG